MDNIIAKDNFVIEIPDDVDKIIKELEKNGYEAYAVGGCVRDSMLGRVPQDWDITTSANPYQVKALFTRTIDTGLKHGTVTIMIEKNSYEVTTYRLDGEYEDGRHPASVEFTSNLEEDLKRRDFTINAMAYNKKTGLVDKFGGCEDLERKIIRCVGEPEKRFEEDALRIMRAVRFCGQLGFSMDKATYEAIRKFVDNLEKVSYERIRVELTKLIISDNADQLALLYETGITRKILPEFDKGYKLDQKNQHHIYTVGVHIIHTIINMNLLFKYTSDKPGDNWKKWIEENICEDIYKCIDSRMEENFKKMFDIASGICTGMDEKQHVILSTTMLFHDIAKPEVMTIDNNGIGHFVNHPQKGEQMAKNIMKRLTYDNESTDIARGLITWHDYRFEGGMKSIRRAVSKIGRDIIYQVFIVHFADMLAQNPLTFNDKLEKLFDAYDKVLEVLASDAALSIKDLKINGNDLIKAGVKPGPQIGYILGELLERVLDKPELNEFDKLLVIANEINTKE